jgi:hypothetical protein
MREHGVTPHHRRSFITTQRVLAGEQEVLPLFAPEAERELPPELDVVLPVVETDLLPISA